MGKSARVTEEGLTLQEEAAVQAFLRCGNETEAYREAYNNATSNPGTDRVAAQNLFKRPRVKARLQSLIKKTEAAALYTSDVAMQEAKEAYDLAKKLGTPAAMVSAVTLRSKLAGILIERRENTNRTAKDLSDAEVEEMLKQSLQEAGYVVSKAITKAAAESKEETKH